MVSWIGDWANLQIKEEKKHMLMVGAKLINQVANEFYKPSQPWRPEVLRLGG